MWEKRSIRLMQGKKGLQKGGGEVGGVRKPTLSHLGESPSCSIERAARVSARRRGKRVLLSPAGKEKERKSQQKRQRGS